MHRIHHHLCKKFRMYHRWHQHPLHRHVHWGVLGAVVLGVALSFVILGWSEVEVTNVQVARAQSGGFDQRRQEYIANSAGYSRCGHDIWGYLERNDQIQQARIHEVIQSWINPEPHEGPGGCWQYGYGANELFLTRVVRQYRDRLSPQDIIDAERYVNDFGASNYYPQGSTNGILRDHIAHYLWAQDHPSAVVQYGRPYCTECGPSITFTWNGKIYEQAKDYNALELGTAWLNWIFHKWVFDDDPSGELEGDYTRTFIHGLRDLYEFAYEAKMRTQAKMVTDFILFDSIMDTSVRMWGGSHGRKYGWSTLRAGSDIYWYPYWGMEPRGSSDEAIAYVSTYRLPNVILDLGLHDDEPDDYWHLNTEDKGYGSVFEKRTFVSKHYNLGGDDSAWMGSMGSPIPDGDRIQFWINDEQTIFPPAGGEYYLEADHVGEGGGQWRNAMYVDVANPNFFVVNSNAFDAGAEQLEEVNDPVVGRYWRIVGGRGWYFFKEGKGMLGIVLGSSGAGVEMGVEGVDGSFSEFQNRLRSQAGLVGGGYKTSRGDVIGRRYNGTYTVTTRNGNDAYQLPFPRIEATDNSNEKRVYWNGNTVIVTHPRHGLSCSYDFNSWTTSGDCGGEPAGPPTCSDGQDNDGDGRIDLNDPGCADANDWSEVDTPSCIPTPETCDQKDNDCDTQIDEGGVCGGGTPACADGVDNDSDSFIDLSDPGCSSASDPDEYNAPSGSCPTTCITMGGDTCSDSLKNATEITACSTAYCAPNYAPKSYCVKCNPGSTLNPATDRCEAGSTQNQPPRNLVLRYLGPTPTGGNLCGNGTINTGEQCDGKNLNGQTCQSLGFQSGTPACYPAGSANQCTFNTSGCTSGPQCTPSCGAWSDPANQCGTRSCTRADCSTYSDTKTCGTTYDPRQGHTYPRLSAFTWGGAVPWYYAQLDLIDTGNSNPAFAQAIKAINPNTRVVVTKDIQAGFSEAPLPQEWRARASRDYNGDGKPDFCVIYGGSQASGPYYYDITDAAPLSAMPQTNCGAYCGQRYNQYIDDLYRQTVDLSVFDGVATDGLWDRYSGGAPCDSDIDLDRDGQNDYSQRGKQGVDNQISAGALKMIQGMRAAAGPNKLVIVNSGGPHTYGMQDSNGFIHEHFIGHFGFDWNKGVYENWMANGVQPVTPIVNTDTVGGSPITPHRNDFPLMRYGLTFALVTGSYFDFTDYDRAGEHYWVKYYDEYDTNLGYPLGPAQKTPSGAWVRFFDNGMAITNGSDTDTVTVRVSEVRGMTGYNPGSTGLYHRFRGGQDLAVNGTNAMNNGDPFDDTHPIVLKNRQQLGRDTQGELHPAQADGIILLREPAAVVSDIIIDNWNSGTSPGSRAPGDYYEDRDAFSGFTQAADPVGDWCRFGSDYYTTRCSIFFKRDSANNYMKDARGEFIPSEFYHSPPFATASAGSSASAKYTPNIGVVGDYEACEWHGTISSGTLASSVTYLVNHASGATPRSVNQQANAGRWNSLGTYRFNAGSQGNITVSASGATGGQYVMADAIRFIYQDGSGRNCDTL